MSTGSPHIRRVLLIAASAALAGLIYLQVAPRLPDSLQISNANSLRRSNAACALAPVPPDHMFLSASVGRGGEHSGLVLDKVPTATQIVQVTVEPGAQPLTIFLSGYGVIWNFSGDVARVRRVVAMSHFMNLSVGVAGIPAERVEIPPNRECRYCEEAMSLQHATVRAKALSVLFGRRPDRDAFQYQAFRLAVPEVSFALHADAMGGAARPLDPAAVVAAVAVARPQVMPGRAGLEQLEADGAIRRPTADEVEAFLVGVSRPYRTKLSPDYLLQTKFDYAITREVTLPQGLFAQSWFGVRAECRADAPEPCTVVRL